MLICDRCIKHQPPIYKTNGVMPYSLSLNVRESTSHGSTQAVDLCKDCYGELLGYLTTKLTCWLYHNKQIDIGVKPDG